MICNDGLMYNIPNWKFGMLQYLLEHDGGSIFIEIIDLSCFTYIILRVLNSMVIFFGYKISPNMMGIQVGYNKNYHRKWIGCYDQFDAW